MPETTRALVELCDTLIQSRQHVGPKHLGLPAPDDATLTQLFEAAAAAPDHRQLTPWRFLVLGPAARERLSEVFAQALLERDADALPEQLADARAKAFRGPVLVLAVADLRADEPDAPEPERWLSLGCAIQNLLLAAQARGFGTGLSSGRAMGSAALREAFDIAPGEQAVCFISIGTPTRAKSPRVRPAVQSFVRWL
ncbi:nitroreductase family protein [Ideonella margarita]|uniref:Putative NAD(P)H nitroreductase n=1 Tax=Ideonella margarita TaxID=2984191 RepID=A0ABU9C4S8_9BURK